MMKLTEREKRLLSQLREEPGLLVQIEGLLEEVRDEQGKLDLADEMEDALAKRVMEMGREALSQWARNKAKEADQDASRTADRRNGKKKSGG